MEAEVLNWNVRKFLPDHTSSYTIIHLQCCHKFPHECTCYEKLHACRQSVMMNTAELSLGSVVTDIYKTCCWHGRTDCADGIISRYGPDVQTSRGAHTASCKRGIGFFFSGVNRAGRGTDHEHPSKTEVKERIELYLWALKACSRVNLTFLLTTQYTRTCVIYTHISILQKPFCPDIKVNAHNNSEF